MARRCRRNSSGIFKGEDTGWNKQPRSLNIRANEKSLRAENEQRWRAIRQNILEAGRRKPCASDAEAKLSYDTTSDGLIFGTHPLESRLDHRRSRPSSGSDTMTPICFWRCGDPAGRK